MPEQAVLDFMIQEFNIQPKWLEMDIYAVYPDEAKDLKAAKILHSFGTKKFWSGLENPQWIRNYSEWISLGGSPYRLPSNYIRFCNRIRYKLLNELDAFLDRYKKIS